MQARNALDFAGHDIYVGLDIGKKSWQTCILIGGKVNTSFMLLVNLVSTFSSYLKSNVARVARL